MNSTQRVAHILSVVATLGFAFETLPIAAQSLPPPPPFGLGNDYGSGFYPNLEELGGLYQLDVFARMTQHRLKDIRDTKKTGQPLAQLLPIQVASSGGVSGLLDDGKINASGLSVYFNGDHSWGRKNGTENELGAKFRLSNGMLGADKRINENLVMGLTAGAGQARANVYEQAGSIRNRMSVLGAYATTEMGDWYAEGFLLAGRNRFKINRCIDVGGDQFFLPSSPSGTLLSASLSGGRSWTFDATSLTAYARAQYDVLRIGVVTEEGATGYELTYGKQSYKSLKTALGISAVHNISTSFGVLVPTASLEWVHEFERDSRSVTGTLTADPRIVVKPIYSDRPTRDYALISVGVSGVFADGWAAFLNIDSMLFMKGFRRDSIVLGVRKEL